MTTYAALIAGLATSLHCAGMCGPMACGLGTLARTEGERLTAASLYHGSRLLSYSVIGAVCGALGQQPLKWFFESPAVLLPWVLALVLFAMALGLDKRVPRPAVFKRLVARARFKTGKLSAFTGAAAMGFLTPLLPCGPLYLVFGAALLAGSAAKGAEFTIAFGLGTVPMLWFAQHQFHHIRAKLTPRSMNLMRRGLALVTAIMMVVRLQDTIPPLMQSEGTNATKPAQSLPSCCH